MRGRGGEHKRGERNFGLVSALLWGADSLGPRNLPALQVTPSPSPTHRGKGVRKASSQQLLTNLCLPWGGGR